VGAYHCVSPIDWRKLTKEIIPDWCNVFENKTLFPFVKKYVLLSDKVVGDQVVKESIKYFSENLFRIPNDYLNDIGWDSQKAALSTSVLMLHTYLLNRTT
jgi:hypothetical protein